MGQSERRNKSQKLAAWLALVSPRRTVANCPLCHKQQGLSGLPNHIFTCKGRRRA